MEPSPVSIKRNLATRDRSTAASSARLPSKGRVDFSGVGTNLLSGSDREDRREDGECAQHDFQTERKRRDIDQVSYRNRLEREETSGDSLRRTC